MKVNQPLTVICLLALAGFLLPAGYGCAVQVPPSGGPRDTLPPVLLNVQPPDSARNIGSRKITFNFDEYVKLNNVSENLLVNPVPRIRPEVNGRLRTVTVQLKDSLTPNTTYSLDFGKAIQDVNEGNILKNLTYTFTTGSYIDSLELAGRVVLAETGGVDSTLMVLLYSQLDDSAVAKERPRYVTRLDPQGHFLFRFLAPGNYALYALKDESGSLRYTSNQQLFAFADAPIAPGDSSKPVLLYAYAAKPEAKAQQPATAAPAKKGKPDQLLRFSNNLQNGAQDLLGPLEILFPLGPLAQFDSGKVVLLNDSLQPVRTDSISLDSSRTRLTIAVAWQENTPYHLLLEQDFASDSLGHKLAHNDTLSFRTKKTADYGLIRLRFPKIDSSLHPVIQFVQKGSVSNSYPLTGQLFQLNLFPPGEYELRLLYDSNGNGRWDPGSFFGEHRQPEHVIAIPRKLNVKANWDNEVNIDLQPPSS